MLNISHNRVSLDLVYFTTRVRHEWGTNNASAKQVLHERHECDTNVARMTRVQHECYTNGTSATLVKTFDFENGTGENVFSHPCIYYMASQRLQAERQFHSKKLPFGHVLFPCQNAFKKRTTKTKLCNGKSYIKKLYAGL